MKIIHVNCGSQCAINVSSRKSNLKKIQASTGFEPMILRYRCNALSTELPGYPKVNCELVIYLMIVKYINMNIWKSYMWTADEKWVKFDPRISIHISLMFHSQFTHDFHIFIFMYFTIIGYITNSQLTIYPYGLVAQWIEHCTGIARSWVRIPFKPEFFSGCFSTA